MPRMNTPIEYVKRLIDHPGLSVFMPVNDDWCPNFKLGRWNYSAVHLRMMQLHPSKDWRVCVWGADDLGMYKDFPEDQFEEAFALFHHLVSRQRLSMEVCKKAGLVRA